MIALINPAGEIIREIPDERVNNLAPLKPGYRRIPIVYEDQDVSTPGNLNVITDPIVQTIEETRVLRVRRRRDRTAEEINTNLETAADAIIRSDVGQMLFSIYKVLFAMRKEANPGLGHAQFRNFVITATNATDVPEAGFKAWVRDRL